MESDGGGERRGVWKMKGEKMKANREYYLLLCVFVLLCRIKSFKKEL
jgi:hypothetical protein